MSVGRPISDRPFQPDDGGVAGGKLEVVDTLHFTKGGDSHKITVKTDEDGVHVGCTLLTWEAWYWIKHTVAREAK